MPHAGTPPGLVTGDRRDQQHEHNFTGWSVKSSKQLSAALRHDYKVKLGRYMEASIEDLHTHTRLRCFDWEPRKFFAFLVANSKGRFSIWIAPVALTTHDEEVMPPDISPEKDTGLYDQGILGQVETPFDPKAFRESAQKAAASAEAETEKAFANMEEASDKKECLLPGGKGKSSAGSCGPAERVLIFGLLPYGYPR